MKELDFITEYKNKINNIDLYIEDYLNSLANVEPVLKEGMKYAVLNGGKRLRSILCTEVCKCFSGDENKSMPYATAIEFIHAYSLVHDDLPAMDNADLRRGMPSCHKKFGEDIAILIGDSLLNNAFEIMLDNTVDTTQISAAKVIASSAGIYGMINGQARDLELSKKPKINESDLLRLIEQKTMALIKCSAISGAIIAGCNDSQLETVNKFAYHLGLAFQLRDDFEDYDEDQMAEHSCPNFINVLGFDKAKEKLSYNCNEMIKYLKLFDNNDFLMEFCKFLFPEFVA